MTGLRLSKNLGTDMQVQGTQENTTGCSPTDILLFLKQVMIFGGQVIQVKLMLGEA